MLVPIKVILCQCREKKDDLCFDNGVYWRLTARTARGRIGVHVGMKFS